MDFRHFAKRWPGSPHLKHLNPLPLACPPTPSQLALGWFGGGARILSFFVDLASRLPHLFIFDEDPNFGVIWEWLSRP